MDLYVFRNHTGLYAYSLQPRDDVLAVCKTLRGAQELCSLLNRADGPTRELAIATHKVRRAA